MNEIKLDCHSMENTILSLQEEMNRLKHKGELVIAIPEINEMNPLVFLDKADIEKWGRHWSVTLQFDKCYARIVDNCRILFVHFDDYYMGGRKEELVPYYSDEQLVEEFKKHVDFLK